MKQTTKSIGDDGEKQACEYAIARGFKIIERNWRTRYCEIDIVAQKDKRLYFIEVKTRKNAHFGSGLDYITKKKQQQMGFAAEMWVQQHAWDGEYQLAAMSVTEGEVEFIDEL